MNRLLLMATLLFSVLSLDARDIYIFSVGVSDYPGTGNDLVFPANDAKAMTRLYRKQGSKHIYLLTDNRATRSTILSKARELFSMAEKDDIVVFYFSGHGCPGGFVAYDQLLTYRDVKGLLSPCKAKNKMIFADACYAGDFRGKSADKSRRDLTQSVMLFLSSRDNEVSYDGYSGMNNGIFTACLLSGLKGGADKNRDRVITARELFDAVSKGVTRLQPRQHPVMWGNFDDNMSVMIW